MTTGDNTPIFAYAAFEALIKAMELPADSPVWEILRTQCGFDARHPHAEYPYRTFVGMVEIFRQLAYPNLPPDEAYYEIAKLHARSYINDTILGRVGYAARTYMSQPKFLETFIRNHNLVAQFGRRSVAHIAPGHSRITFADDPSSPTFVRGTLYEVLESNRATGIRIEAQTVARHHTVYDLYWNDSP